MQFTITDGHAEEAGIPASECQRLTSRNEYLKEAFVHFRAQILQRAYARQKAAEAALRRHDGRRD